MKLRYALQSQQGRRSSNEDVAFAGPRLLALADGMGGHAAGEVAASTAIAEVIPLNDQPPREPLEELRGAIRRADEAIARAVDSQPNVAGMGTTLTAMLFDREQVAIAHVGDSRAYLLRDGSLRQITRDDSFIQSMIDEGRLSPEEARRHPQRAMVLKVLIGKNVDPWLELLDTKPGDRFLICSDGLSDYVPFAEIEQTLQSHDPQRCPQELIRRAMRNGSQDNVTCIVAEVSDEETGYDIPLLSGAGTSEGRVT